jgi:hypothetical protein
MPTRQDKVSQKTPPTSIRGKGLRPRRVAGWLLIFGGIAGFVLLLAAEFPLPEPKPMRTLAQIRAKKPQPKLPSREMPELPERPERPPREPAAAPDLPAFEAVRGQYHIADGYVVRVNIDQNKMLNLQLLHDPGWFKAPESTFKAWRFGARPTRIGERITVDPGVGTMHTGPIVWDMGHRVVIHAYVGTEQSDVFTRSNAASHCLFLTMGGDDVVLREPGRREWEPTHDVMVGLSGEAVMPTDLGEWASSPTSSSSWAGDTPVHFQKQDTQAGSPHHLPHHPSEARK